MSERLAKVNECMFPATVDFTVALLVYVSNARKFVQPFASHLRRKID